METSCVVRSPIYAYIDVSTRFTSIANLSAAVTLAILSVHETGGPRCVTRAVQGGNNSPGAKSLWGRRNDCGVQTSPKNVTSTFFNTENLLSKELRFKYWSAKLASCLGRHLTSLRPWVYVSNASILWNCPQHLQ